MWLITEIGFFSAVKDRDSGKIMVRSRAISDLESLCKNYLGFHPIQTTNDSDYRHRLWVAPEIWARAVENIAMDIDYDNFKDRVVETQGTERAAIYLEVWHDLYEIQRAEIRDELVRADSSLAL